MKKLLLILLCLPMIGFGQCISGNCENGYGTYTWADGAKYVGEWKDSNRHGKGTYTYGKGENQPDKYIGEFKEDYAHGQGSCTWANGEKYVGEYKNGNRHGKGTYTYTDGTVFKGIWRNDEIIEGL